MIFLGSFMGRVGSTMKLKYNANKALIADVDCIEGINVVFVKGKRAKVDFAITSPPYFNARNYGGETLFTTEYEWGMWCTHVIRDICNYSLKDTGVLWWNTGSGYNNFRKMTSVYRMIIDLEESGIYLIDDIPWIKTSAPPKRVKNRPYPAWEHNFIFAKYPSQVTFYRDNVRRPYAESSLTRMKHKLGNLSSQDGEYTTQAVTVKPNPDGATPPNYLLLSKDNSKRPHPAPMLPMLANWAIRAYCPEGGWVFDPMMGIGTSMIESLKLGRNFLGFELFKEYINIAKISFDKLATGLDPYNGLKLALTESTLDGVHGEEYEDIGN